MHLVFENCMTYNKRNSGFYKAAQKMKKKLKTLLVQRGIL